MSNLIPKYGGYRHLKTFQLARLIYDITYRFCNKFVPYKSRTHDQMVQAARSGVQNIAEGSTNSGTSKKSELNLTNVARGSLEELKLDYEDFLRQRGQKKWDYGDPLRNEIIKQRFTTADEFALWVKKQNGEIEFVAANGVLVLLNVVCVLLDRQIMAQAQAFEREGGFSERMYKARTAYQNNPNKT